MDAARSGGTCCRRTFRGSASATSNAKWRNSKERAPGGRALGTWSDIAARIKATYAQWYYVQRNERLTREILDLMRRLERIAQVRYSGGLAALQDVIRAQVEQTTLHSELVTLGTEQQVTRIQP